MAGQPASRCATLRRAPRSPERRGPTVSETATPRTDRVDFQATSDPAVLEAADRGEAKLLGYHELYLLWERQQWRTQDLDFTQDRIDWHDRMDDDERFQRMYGLASFFIGEQRVTDELGPIMRAAPTEDQRIFLSTQIADEARHVRFFDRFFSEVGVLEGADDLAERLAALDEHLNEAFRTLFDDLLRSRVDRLGSNPDDRDALVEAVTLYHMVIEGMLALTGQHFIIDYNERIGTLPAFVEGFSNVARDEHRHIAFGVRFLTDCVHEDERYRGVIQGMLEQAIPVADKVIDPPWAEEDDYELFGVSREESHAFAAQSLTRRLKVIGLMPASA